jgi:hypothetical protein
MSYVSLTDFFVEEAARRNPLAYLVARASLEKELAVRADSEILYQREKPAEILYCPDERPTHRVRLANVGAGLMRDYVCRAGPLGLETGGFCGGTKWRGRERCARL